MKTLIDILKYDSNTEFVFTHYLFWVFFGIVLLGNTLFYKRNVLRSSFLFLVSLFFYYKAGGYYFFLLIFSTLVDYTIGLGLGKVNSKSGRRILLWLSILINIGVLSYFKYAYFFSHLAGVVSGKEITVINYFRVFINSFTNSNLDVSVIVLPVGISFFTFQTISYSVDVYRGRLKPVRNIIDFGFYVSFFPQLVAGPIVRAWEFIPQIQKKFTLSYRWFWWAVGLILGGLFKKLVVSDYLAVNIVDRVFDAPMMYSGFELLMGAYSYALQIYCDFSGYTDIAIGLALLLGFRLPENFNRPYLATSVTSFWRRWHISLSSWLRDYLYIPLGGNRRGKARQSVNLMITMLLGGLWHGAGWLFILWGALHGFALLIEKLVSAMLGKVKIKIPSFIGFILTFHFVTLAWIVFRSPDWETLKLYLVRITNAFSIYAIGDVLNSYRQVIAILFAGYLLHWLPKDLLRMIKYQIIKSPVVLKLLLIIVFCLVIYQFSLFDVKPFIYFRF